MMKRFGFGTMRLPLTDPEDSGSIDIEQTKKMVDLFLSRGFTYFDTAWMYHNHRCENAVKTVLTDRYPREAYQLATKLPVWSMTEKDDKDEIFRTQLEKTGVRFFDYYLLHSLDSASYDKCDAFDCWRWIAAQKEKGLVRHIGFSFHGKAAELETLLTAHPEMEFVQLQLNYLDWEDDTVQSRLCYETAVRHGKKVIVMEPVRGGTLARNVPVTVERLLRSARPEASMSSWALRFAASLPEVMMVLSGMSDLAQTEENTALMADLEPLSETEQAMMGEAARLYRESVLIPCTGCNYCAEGCPQKIAIARYFELYNQDAQPEKGSTYESLQPAYNRTAAKKGKAGDCVECGQCEAACPQHLPIMEHLKKVAAHFE